MSTFGEELRRERKLRGIRLREISDATKINLRYLQALEGNDFEHLPGGVFNRGFVRAYSQYIGIDPDAMVNAYLLEEQAQTDQGKAQDRQLFRRRRPEAGEAAPEEPLESGPGRRPLFYVTWITLIALLLLILGWSAMRYLEGRNGAQEEPAEITVPDHAGGQEGEESE
jgi:cytoskeletal protein RodZ